MSTEVSSKAQRYLLVSFLVIAYWCYFLGNELFQTLKLYNAGDKIYHILETTKASNDTESTTSHSLPPMTTSPIPKIMHRMWKNASILDTNNPSIPTNWTRAFHNCNSIYTHRNWTTILWTDAMIRTLLENHYPHFIPVFDSYRYDIQRVDASRYFIIYHYGGVYLDLDIGCQKSRDLTDLIHSMEEDGVGAMLPMTSPVGFSNDVLFASKHNPFFERLMDALPRRNKWYGSPYLSVMYSTGPMFLSLEYYRMIPEQRQELFALSPDLYSEKGTRYFRHLRGSTWHGSDAHLVQWLIRYWGVVLVVALLVFVSLSRRKRRRIGGARRESKPHRLSL